MSVRAVLVGIACAIASVGGARAGGGSGVDGGGAGVRVGLALVGTQHREEICFSDHFLRLVEFETDIDVERGFVPVSFAGASGEDPFGVAFCIITGEGAFDPTPRMIQTMRAYVARGGFLVVSAGCSNRDWAGSMRVAIDLAFGDDRLEVLPMEHELFATIFDIAGFAARRATDREIALEGIHVDGRLAVLFSAEGLNDTRNAGGGCCCCAGNEIVNASYINANALAYALMR